MVAPALPFGWVEEPPSINRLLGLAWLGGHEPATHRGDIQRGGLRPRADAAATRCRARRRPLPATLRGFVMRLLYVLIVLLLPLGAQAQEVTVFAAASLTDAMKDISAKWAAAGHQPLVHVVRLEFDSGAADRARRTGQRVRLGGRKVDGLSGGQETDRRRHAQGLAWQRSRPGGVRPTSRCT